MSKPTTSKTTLHIQNRRAHHDYHIIKEIEAGLVLEGWEVKAIKAGRIQLKDSHIIVKRDEAWLIACHISPLPTTAHYTKPDPLRTRKLLLHRKEINKLIGETAQKGFTMVPLNIHLRKGRIKCQIALTKGKKNFDKRQDARERDWNRDKERILKSHTRS